MIDVGSLKRDTKICWLHNHKKSDIYEYNTSNTAKMEPVRNENLSGKDKFTVKGGKRPFIQYLLIQKPAQERIFKFSLRKGKWCDVTNAAI